MFASVGQGTYKSSFPFALVWDKHHEYSKNLTRDKHQNHSLLRRHAIDLSLFRRDIYEVRHSNLPSATFRICHKREKVCVDTSAGNRVFGPDNQLCHCRTCFKQKENKESSFRLSEFVKQSTNINFEDDKVDWFVDVNYSNSFTSKVELSFPPNATNIIFIGKPFLFKQNCFERKLKSRTEMVGTKLRTVRWPDVNSNKVVIQTDASAKDWG